MRNKRSAPCDPQEERLDGLLHLAWLCDEERKREQLLSGGDADLDVDEARAMRLFEDAWRRRQEAGRLAEKQRGRGKVRQLALRALRTAAVLVAALSLGIGMTLAVSEEARIMALRLLVNIDPGTSTAYMQLMRPNLEGIDIPAGWEGSFYPAYLPDGYTWQSYAAKAGDGYAITFTNGRGGTILFEELNGYASAAIGIEGMAISYTEINGDQAFVRREIEGSVIGVDWANDICWLSVVTDGVAYTDVLQIAQSVVYIR